MIPTFRLSFFAVLVFIAFGTSACFDIDETFLFRKDGSGTASMKVDLSQMISLMESLSESVDSVGDSGESMEQLFAQNESVANLKSIPGISKVKDLNNQETGVIGYSYEFASIEALNNALVATEGLLDVGKLMGDGEQGGSLESEAENRFQMKGKKLTRIYILDPEDGDDAEADSEEEQYQKMAEMMFANHFYTIRYNFDRDVKKVSKNDQARVAGRKVTVKVPMQELLNGEAIVGSVIKLK
ncbi:MAG: hypothetical protein AAGN35_06200 [Bacteroidota bacterium]